jgi:hypothetical protein
MRHISVLYRPNRKKWRTIHEGETKLHEKKPNRLQMKGELIRTKQAKRANRQEKSHACMDRARQWDQLPNEIWPGKGGYILKST